MRHKVLVLAALCAVLALAACNGVYSINDADVAGTPTTYAKVLKEPNPLLLGHWRRSAPSELNRPWLFSYDLVKKGDRYAVYYFYDSRMKNAFKGWADFTIDGDRMTSGVDGSVFYVQDGEVVMQVAGRADVYHMMKVE